MIEPQDLFWVGAETFFQFREDRFEFFAAAGLSEAMVELHAQRRFIDITIGQGCVEGKFDFGLGKGGRGVSFECIYGFFQKLAVEVETNGRNLAGLLRSQDVSRTAYL